MENFINISLRDMKAERLVGLKESRYTKCHYSSNFVCCSSEPINATFACWLSLNHDSTFNYCCFIWAGQASSQINRWCKVVGLFVVVVIVVAASASVDVASKLADIQAHETVASESV